MVSLLAPAAQPPAPGMAPTPAPTPFFPLALAATPASTLGWDVWPRPGQSEPNTFLALVKGSWVMGETGQGPIREDFGWMLWGSFPRSLKNEATKGWRKTGMLLEHLDQAVPEVPFRHHHFLVV